MKTMLIILLSGLFLCGCSKKQAANDYPKRAWTFAGYASPDAALESWVWAMSKGDKAVMLQSLTPEARKDLEKGFAGETDAKISADATNNAARFQGYTIQSRVTNSDDDVTLVISITGIGAVQKMEVKRIGGEWKLAGPKN